MTPFIVIDDNLFDHKPNFMATKFGGVRVVKKTAYDKGSNKTEQFLESKRKFKL